MTNRQTKTATSLAFMITCGLALSTSIALTTLFSGFTIFGLAVLSYRLYTSTKDTQKALATAQAENQTLTQTNADLKAQLATANQHLSASQAQQAPLTNTIEQLETQLKNINQQLKQAQAYVKDRMNVTTDTAALESKVTHLQNELDPALERIKQVQAALQHCEEELATTKEQLKTTEAKRQKLIAAHQNISTQYKALEAKITPLKKPLILSTSATQTDPTPTVFISKNDLPAGSRATTPFNFA